MTTPYKKHVEHRFEVSGEEFALSAIEADYAFVSETRKNGQEDCHQKGAVYRENSGDKFQWAEGEEMFDAPEKVLAYINKHGLPEQ